MAISRLDSSLNYILGTASIIGGGVALFTAYRYLRPKISPSCNEQSKKNVYESEKVLNEYLCFHYGGQEVNCVQDNAPKECFDFPMKCADICKKYYDPGSCPNDRSLDIGCAVGRSTFELARVFRESIGIDYSFGFVRSCEVLATNRKMEYKALVEGDLTTSHIATIPNDIDTSRCTFLQGDACNLPLDIGQFGCVLAANLICRLPDPKAFILRLKNLVAAGGICVITSPYTFMREYTPRNRWIGGYKDSDGKEVRGFDEIKSILTPSFRLLDRFDLPFLIRETARKHQWTVADVSVWQRIGN